MVPLDFEEFCLAMGGRQLADLIRGSFEGLKPLPDALHKRATRLWREYMLVGGMPQEVVSYVEERDFAAVDYVKRGILSLYLDDMGKYGNGDASRVRSVFAQMPGQLAKHEKKFTLASFYSSARMRKCDSAFFWLEDATLVNVCRNSTDPNVGLGPHEDGGSLKCYQADTGLLVSQAFADSAEMLGEVYREIILDNLSINEGMLVENAVAQQLKAHGRPMYFYSRYERGNSRDTMEIDFLIVRGYDNAAMKPRVSPVEVKSTKRCGTSSRDKLRASFGKRLGTEYVLHPGQLQVEGDRVCLSLYASFCL